MPPAKKHANASARPIAGLASFVNIYKSARRNPDTVGLYLGAGINRPPKGIRPIYDTYLWRRLLEALHDENRQRMTHSLDRLFHKHRNDWSKIAQVFEDAVGPKRLVRQIEEIVYHLIPRGDKYGRLSKRMLDQAPSLSAAICFSARIKRRTETSWTFERKPCIGTAITPNYDFFFGAGWTRYQAFSEQWKIQTPFSSGQPGPTQRPINYIHGYIPYKPGKQLPVDLSTGQYRKFYGKGKAGFSWNVIKDAVETKMLIFVGTSFTDKPLRDALMRRPQTSPTHFAIVRQDLVNEVKKLGIKPIVVHDYAQVPAVLEAAYCSALTAAECQNVGVQTPAQYWEQLHNGPNNWRRLKVSGTEMEVWAS